LGEGPHWDIPSQSLYYVDIRENSIHKYTPSTNEHTKVRIGDKSVSLIVPVGNNKFIVSYGRQIISVNWDGKSSTISDMETLTEIDSQDDVCINRINDGKCDPTGRLWFGTMGPEKGNGQFTLNNGSLFSLESKGDSKSHLNKLSISNGLAWNADTLKFYFIDSLKYTVDEYDVDLKTGIISNGKPIFTLTKHDIEGLPDGMTIDTDGNLWVAIFNGYRVIKIDPRKPETLLQTVKIPAKKVTSVAFGGPNLDELYVTTAKLTQGNEVLAGPVHGCLYKVTGLGVKGLPATNFKL